MNAVERRYVVARSGTGKKIQYRAHSDRALLQLGPWSLKFAAQAPAISIASFAARSGSV